MYNEQKKGDFVTMEILAEKLTHDEARSIEGALIRKKNGREHTAFLTYGQHRTKTKKIRSIE